MSAPESQSWEEKWVTIDSPFKEAGIPGIPENWKGSREK